MQIQDTTAEGHFLSANQGACAESNCTARDADVSKELEGRRSRQLALKRANVNNNIIDRYPAPPSRKEKKIGV